MIANYMMYKNLPCLDLHGEDRITAKIKLEEFINDNSKLKRKLLIIVHGVGTGILKETVHKTLKQNKKVKTYKLDIFNKGATIVELN